jgi:DNA polymerase III subunit gamma/tau
MGYQALYRKYRPRHFSEVIGQEHIVRTLLNTVKQEKIGHAYLFSGPRGTGKTTIARILARAINCGHTESGEPCDNCPRCKGAEEGLGVLEIDAASHGSVDDMRTLVAQVSQIPLSGGMMVYIIDEVHMLSKEAFNAFLKTLEEPPPHAVFVLATTEPGKLLPTIHSRCQHFAFRRVPIEVVSKHIGGICKKENIPAEDAAIRIIARAGDGSIRDSMSVLEQAIAFEPEGLTLGGVRQVLGIPDRVDIRVLAGHIINDSPGDISATFAHLIEMGREPALILTSLLMHFRDVLFSALEIDNSDLNTLPSEELDLVEQQATQIDPSQIHRAISFLAKIESEIKWEDEAALILEAALLRMAGELTVQPQEETARPAAQERPAQPRQSAPPPEMPERQAPQRRVPEQTYSEPAPEPTYEKPPVRTTPSLTGGLTLKKKTAHAEEAPVPTLPPAPTHRAIQAPTTPATVPSEVDFGLTIPENLDPFWVNALESVRELSIHEYILLAEAEPTPPPSEWPAVDKASSEPVNLTLRYPSSSGLVARMVNEPVLLNRLTARLSEVLERPVTLKISKERGQATASQVDCVDDAADANKNSTDGPALFKNAGRAVPSDPNLKQIHSLIADDFPDYTVQSNGPKN